MNCGTWVVFPQLVGRQEQYKGRIKLSVVYSHFKIEQEEYSGTNTSLLIEYEYTCI